MEIWRGNLASEVHPVFFAPFSPLVLLRAATKPCILKTRRNFASRQRGKSAGGCYVIAKRHGLNDLDDLLSRYGSHCRSHSLPFERHRSILSPDPSTLFTTSGMQKRKPQFSDPGTRGLTVCDVQPCFRTVDLDAVGDGAHSLRFQMLGLFSFRHWTLLHGMRFWLDFVRSVGVEPTTITVHPDQMGRMKPLWDALGVGDRVRPDVGCVWSDGSIGGHCTELYVGDLEIGNIVNPLGDCLDCGFGLERIGMCLGLAPPMGAIEVLVDGCETLLSEGVLPGSKKQAFVFRRLLGEIIRRGGRWEHPLFDQEVERLSALRSRYERLRRRHPNESPQWWRETHGIDVSLLGPGEGGVSGSPG
jgi:hypothetical protein